MSVVNDVLRDLDNRKRQHQYAGAVGFMIKDKRYNSAYGATIKYYISFGVVLFLASLFYYYNTNIQGVNPVYEQIDEVDGVMKNDSIDPVEIITGLESSVIHEDKEEAKIAVTLSDDVLKINNIAPKELKAIKQPEVTKIENINSDFGQQKIVINKKLRPIYDYIGLLSSDPGAVYPLILKTIPNLSTNKKMLALSAQGEQRSGRHISAINLYTILIDIDNQEPKWKVGAAISYEKDNRNIIAKKLYINALKSRELQPSLKAFVIDRISYIDSRVTNEK